MRLISAPLFGADPTGSTGGPTVYVSKILDGVVVAIDVDTDEIVAFIRTGTNPAEVAVVHALNRAFVADLADGSVTVIDTTVTPSSIRSTWDIRSRRSTPTSPLRRSTLSTFRMARRARICTRSTPAPSIETADVALGSRLQNIAVDPSRNRAYLTDFVDGVIVVDTSNLSVVTTLAVADLPHGIAVHPALDRLYVTQLDSDSVIVVDATTLAVIDTLSVGDTPQWIAVDQTRNKAFVSNEGDNTVTVIDLSTNAVHPTTVPVGTGPLTVTVHEAAAKAYVYNIGDGTISIINTITEELIATLDPVFVDNFESGNTTAWSRAVP